MFTFSHVTSIGIDEAEYQRRLALGETNLVKGEAKWYREIATEIKVPVTYEDFCDLAAFDKDLVESVKLGNKKFNVTRSMKAYIVGIKLDVNQKVQAANRDGNDGPKAADVCASVVRVSEPRSADWNAALRACAGTVKAKKAFADAWMAEHPDFVVVAE